MFSLQFLSLLSVASALIAAPPESVDKRASNFKYLVSL